MKLSCGIIPVRKKGNHWEYLLLRCFKNWDFPKGMKDENEEPLSAAKRELAEETGITNIDIKSPDKFIETEKYSHGKVARYYLGVLESEVDIQLLPNPVSGMTEHHEFRWLKKSEAEKLLVPRIKKVLSWAEKNLPENQ